MENEKFDKWKLPEDMPEYPKDSLIYKVLKRIEYDEEIEYVYELLECIPRKKLIAYLES